MSTFAFNYGVALPKLADEQLGRRGLVRARAVGDQRRLVHRLAADGPHAVGLDALVPRQRRSCSARPASAWRGRRTWPSALLWAVPLGIGGAAFISGGNGITQQESPTDMRGRLLALTAVAFLGSTPIGGPITGVIGDRVGAAVGAGLRQRDHAAHRGGRRSAVVRRRRPGTAGLAVSTR